MMFKKIALKIILLYTVIGVAQRKVQIDFSPKLNKKYEYSTHTHSKVSSQKITTKIKNTILFSKEKESYKVLQEFTDVQLIEGDDLLFFLNQPADSVRDYKTYSLKKFLTEKKLSFKLDNNGNIIQNNNDTFFEETPFLKRREKKFFKEFLNNSSLNTFNYFSGKTFTVGESFTIKTINQYHFDKNQSVQAKLLAVVDNKAIFKLYSEPYTLAENENKDSNEMVGIFVINTKDGMPLQMRLFLKNHSLILRLKGEPEVDVVQLRKSHLSSGDYEITKVPELLKKTNRDSLITFYSKILFDSKKTAKTTLQNLQPLSLNYTKNCIQLNLNTYTNSAPVFIKIKNIRAYNSSKELILEQNVHLDFNLTNYEDSSIKELPIGYELCKLPISFLEVDIELLAPYGDTQIISLTRKNSKKYDIVQWNDKDIQTRNFGDFHMFYDEHKNIVPIKKIIVKGYSSSLPFLKDTKEREMLLLYYNLLDNSVDNRGFHLYFDKEIKYIDKIAPKGEFKVSKTIKLSVKQEE
ncbi:hypothetical protein [Tenacibaculum lutimaris]|nr:hypothetical protein [Tenacibaculum lutimaris]